MNQLSTSLHLQLAGLSQKTRADFELWQERLAPILSLKKGHCRELAALAAREDLPIQTVTRKYYLVRNKGWMALINRALAGPRLWKTRKATGLPTEDRELVKLYCELNQRSSHSAMKQLRRDWTRKRICAGMRVRVGTDETARINALLRRPRSLARNGFPVGWSTSNLLAHKPTKFQLKAVRIGRSAAASERPLVYTTRRGLYVGSHIMLDDMWHDHVVNTFVERQSGRPLELSAHDLFPAYKRRWGIRVRTRKDDGSHHGLTEKMTRMILAATLFLDGYSPRGTIMIAEHGMAAIRDAIEKALFDMSGGLITTSRSGMLGDATHLGQYPGIGKGNSRFKASHESSHNLTHNVLGDLPGQTGKDRDHQPEEHAALLRNNDDLLAATKYLSPESAALLQFPILEVTQFMHILAERYEGIAEDPDHDLEGWVESRLTTTELLLGGQWIDQARLLQDAAQWEIARTLVAAGTIENRLRKMTRGEVWRAGAGELIQIPGSGVCAILGDDLACERKVRGNRFEFEDQEVGTGTHRYESVAFTPQGEALQLRDGEIYETFVNPFATGTLFVRRANGAYIGECRRIETPCRGDVEAVQRACGTAAKREGELLAPIRTRHLGEAREKARRHQQNAAVLGGAALTIEDREVAGKKKSAARFGEILHELSHAEATDGTESEASDSGTQPEIETW